MHFHVYKDADGDWRWKLVAGNGKIIAVSGEGYKRKAHALKMIMKIIEGVAHAPVVY